MENTIEWGGSKTGLARRTTEGSGQIEVLEQRAVGSEKIPHQIGGANIDTPPHRNYSPVIGITGWMGSGKTEAANWICQAYDWEALKMAAPIKTMLSSVGLSNAHLEGDLKEIETPMLCGKTPRFAMQTLGTEWGRNIISPDLWVNLWAIQAENVLDDYTGVVADDVRFNNEADIIHSMNGLVIKISRSGHTAGSHESETYIVRYDYEIVNDGNIPDLMRSIDSLFSSISFDHRSGLEDYWIGNYGGTDPD